VPEGETWVMLVLVLIPLWEKPECYKYRYWLSSLKFFWFTKQMLILHLKTECSSFLPIPSCCS